MWGGDECLCALFGFDPDDPPRDGTFTVVLPTEQAEALTSQDPSSV